MFLNELQSKIPKPGIPSDTMHLRITMLGVYEKNAPISYLYCLGETDTLLQKITDTTIAYLKEKVKAGVDAVQVFDSWGGMLSPLDYQEFSWKYINQITEALKDDAPVIAFGKGCWFALEEMAKSNVSALGVDYCSNKRFRFIIQLI